MDELLLAQATEWRATCCCFRWPLVSGESNAAVDASEEHVTRKLRQQYELSGVLMGGDGGGIYGVTRDQPVQSHRL